MKKHLNKFSGAICGGGRKEAEKLVKKGHCKRHKKYREECGACQSVRINLIDANFMALM